MYELVNTSLPNGLIPGTHGFAVVAMTKGLPDALRTRFETYCAYSHRTSAHDAAYFTENPVNWFHVTLPQGEHVMGRVAPADFDYTGRTNRLARLLVFSKNEMPAIGGASVLKKECARLSEAWSGEARWLEDDKLTVGRLRLENLQTNCDAPSWRAMFGNVEGLNLARGFARLLAKNLSTTGRTIYFKTSTAYDVDGTRLLALFADLIDLLPVVDRRNVTFSTYPVALPQGTLCHLRGVYDRDRIFDASATTQPWVDCEKGIVNNASLLPPEEVNQRRAEPKVVAAPVRTTQQPASTYGSRPQTVPAWMPPQKNDGTKSLVIGIIAITTILLITAIACGIFLWRKTVQSVAPAASPDNVTETDGQNKGVQPNAPQGGTVTPQVSVRGKSSYPASSAVTNTNNTAKTQTNVAQKQEKRKPESERAERERKAEPEKAKRESKKPQKNDASIFGGVLSVEDIAQIEGGIRAIAKNHIKTNGTLKVYWYDSCGMLTNLFAGNVVKNSVYSNAPVFEPKPDELRKLKKGPRCFFLIWYDTKKKTIYWDWSPLIEKDPVAWFIANTNAIDLVDMCFGGATNEVYKTWEKYCGAPRFTINCALPANETDPLSLQNGGALKLDDMANEYEKREKNQQKHNTEKSEGHLAEYNSLRQKVQEAKNEYEQHRKNLDQQQKAVNNLKDKQKEEAAKKEIIAEKEAIEKIFKETQDTERRWNNIDKRNQSLWSKLEFNNHKITGWDKLLENLNKQIGEVKEKEKQATQNKATEEEENKNRIREVIRNSKFSIIKVERTK